MGKKKKSSLIFFWCQIKKKKKLCEQFHIFQKIVRWREIKADSNWHFCINGQYSRS